MKFMVEDLGRDNQILDNITDIVPITQCEDCATGVYRTNKHGQKE